MEIKVVGPGCKNCKNLLSTTEAAVAELGKDLGKDLGSDIQIVYVTEMADIIATGIMRTPGLLINGKVKVMGRVPAVKEIKQMISGEM